MSGIAGIIHFSGRPAAAVGEISRLTNAMRTLGPDGISHWCQGSVSLGHCMLRTTPESLVETQPLLSQDGMLVLVWDGRLDNRENLIRDLNGAGAILRDESDAEIALQSYAVWGEECPKRLLGDFAFAVWDQHQSKLFCVRDHMGARPFFWTRNKDFFAFASIDEALLKLHGVSNEPSVEHIAYFLFPAYQGFDYSRSWLKEVWSLMAGESMVVTSDGDERRCIYWKLEPGPENFYASDEECQEAFLKVFGEAVRCRMRTIDQIAAMMSGGLDSASIASVIKRILPEMTGIQFHTYSAISDNPEDCIESKCIQALTQDLGSNAHYVSVPSFNGMLSKNDLYEMAWSNPHPIDNSILLPAMMCLAAARDGRRVMLHGSCGDLVTYVPDSYIEELLKMGKWRIAWDQCKFYSLNNTYMHGVSPAFMFAKRVSRTFLPDKIKHIFRKIRYLKRQAFLRKELINNKFSQEIYLNKWLEANVERSMKLSKGLQETHIRVLAPPHGIASSLGAYNRVAGRCGIELRDPWSDRRVVEFWFRLPSRYKIRDGLTKYLVRSIIAKNVDPMVAWRIGKEHLGWNFWWNSIDESNGGLSRFPEDNLKLVNKYINLDVICGKLCNPADNDEFLRRGRMYDVLTLIGWIGRISGFSRSSIVEKEYL